jgi:hypothetical protein
MKFRQLKQHLRPNAQDNGVTDCAAAATGVSTNVLLTAAATDPCQGKKRCNARRNSFSAHIQLLLVSEQHLPWCA